MEITEFGITTELKLELWKAASSIVVTVPGIITEFKLYVPLKALAPITVTL